MLTSTQVAKRLHLSRDQIIVLIQQHRILARKSAIDNRYLIPEVEVCRYQDVIALARGERSTSEIDLIWVQNACQILASRIQEGYPNVDVVISASLGGIIPAMLIYYSLRSRRRLTFLAEVTSTDIIYAGTAVVVNDVLVTGEEFSFIKNLNTEATASVVLHHVYQEGLIFEPDFRIELVKEAPTYPWTVN